MCPVIGETRDGYGFSIISCDNCDPNRTRKPEFYGLPIDYTYSHELFGTIFYKIFDAKTYADARSQCESDGPATLAVPHSSLENKFITDLIPDTDIWIGVNDIDEEGSFVSLDSYGLTYMPWKSGQPDNYNYGDFDEDAVQISGKFNYGPNENKEIGLWNDIIETSISQFVCSFVIRGKFNKYLQ